MLVVLGGIFVLHIAAIILLLVATIDNVSVGLHRHSIMGSGLSDVSSGTGWVTEGSLWHVFACAEASFLCCYRFSVPFRATCLTFLVDRSAERGVNAAELTCTCRTRNNLTFPSVLYWVWHTCRMRCRTPRLLEHVHSSFRVSCIRIFPLCSSPRCELISCPLVNTLQKR